MAKYSVIIPAAGKAERFGGDEKKPFAKLDGRPVFLRTLEHFMSRDDVCQTILAVSSDDLEMVKTTYGANLGFLGVKLVKGGDCRCQTISLALEEVSPDADYVAIHDAARPCVTLDKINAVFAEAIKSNAAILAAPIHGTIKRASEALVIEQTESRCGLFEAQTPQVFKKSLILEAYRALSEDQMKDITDDAQVLELAGHCVTIVKSDATNLKITTKGDLSLAQAILKVRPAKQVKKFGAFEEAQW